MYCADALDAFGGSTLSDTTLNARRHFTHTDGSAVLQNPAFLGGAFYFKHSCGPAVAAGFPESLFYEAIGASAIRRNALQMQKVFVNNYFAYQL